jgi:hypothetical protein
MLVLNRDSYDWKHPDYNVKGHQFVYFIRNHGSDSAKVGLHNRDIASLRVRYKTYYSSFDAYVVRVTDSKHVEKRLFEAFTKHGMHLTHELVRNNTATRDMFKYIASKYDLDHRGRQTHKTAQLVQNYHETTKPAPKAYKPVPKMIKPPPRPASKLNKPLPKLPGQLNKPLPHLPGQANKVPRAATKPVYRRTRETDFLYGKPEEDVVENTGCCTIM